MFSESIDTTLQSAADHSINVSLINYQLGCNNVTVTLQWAQEAGAVYSVSVLPEMLTSPTELNNRHNTVATNLTISYDILHNISIVSSLCGITTAKALKFGEYEKHN